jgi:hypothetical protein
MRSSKVMFNIRYTLLLYLTIHPHKHYHYTTATYHHHTCSPSPGHSNQTSRRPSPILSHTPVFPLAAFRTHDKRQCNLPKGLLMMAGTAVRHHQSLCPDYDSRPTRPFGPRVRDPPTHTLTAKRSWRRNRRTREDALKADATWADPAALCKQSYHSAGLIMRSTAYSGTCNPQTANTSLGFNYCRGMPLPLASAFRLSARSAADAVHLLLLLQALSLRRRLVIAQLAALQRRLTTADIIARLCVRLLSFWKHGWWQRVIIYCILNCLLCRGYHVCFNELLGNFL